MTLELDIKMMEDGVESIKKELDKLENEMIQLIIDEMVDFSYGVLGIAMRHAPKDTGNLRGSGIATIEKTKVAHTEKDEGSEYGAKLIRDLKSGGITLKKFMKEFAGELVFNTSYATDQHENLSYSHVDGEAKYLENAIKGQQDKFAKNIAGILKKNMKGGA